MMRDKIGSFMSRDGLRAVPESMDQQLRDSGRQGLARRRRRSIRLRDAKIEVAEVPGKPGVYRAMAFLRPHFQLDELSVSLRLVAELPASARQVSAGQ